MKIEHPILFTGEMVRAILEGRKTQTRRVIKPQPHAGVRRSPFVKSGLEDGHGREIRCPYVQPGHTLWVRETWHSGEGHGHVLYKEAHVDHCPGIKWKPSIHMPRWASRITLEVRDIKVERVQDITEEDASAEGVPGADDYPISEIYCPTCRGEGTHGALGPELGYMEVNCAECETYRDRFKNLWNAINEPRGYGWNKNPWVWVVKFKKL
jgi:hypothetical protein